MQVFRAALLFLTTSVLYAQPTITAVLDGAALTANLAQGSVFIVKGTGLSNANEFFQASAPAYPSTFHNVAITLTPASGPALNMLLVYTYNLGGVNQLSAVIPSTVPTGNYGLRVINNSIASSPFAVTIVARKPGIVSANGNGIGIAQATLQGQLILQRTSALGKIGDFETRPAHPGDVMTLWGTGLGADPASDIGGSSGDVTAAAAIRVVLNGVDIVPDYAGRSGGYPGLDQVNFKLPANVVLDCNVTIQVRAGSVAGNQLTIATAAVGSDTCPVTNPDGVSGNILDLLPTQSEINAWSTAGKFRMAFINLTRSTIHTITPGVSGGPSTTSTATSDTALPSFQNVTGSSANLKNYFSGAYVLAPLNACVVSTGSLGFGSATFASLDAGSPIALSGPNGNRSMLRQPSGNSFTYSTTLGDGTLGNYLDPGNYTVTVPGGPGVTGFTTRLAVPADFTWTNRASVMTVTRSQGVRVTWAGGDPNGIVSVSGYGSAGAPSFASAAFQCSVKNSDGQFTVPASILSQLPATSNTSAFTQGTLSLDAGGINVRQTVTGLDYVKVATDVLVQQSTIYQ